MSRAAPGTSTDEQPPALRALCEYLQLEHKLQPRLCLADTDENGEVSYGARDGAAHVLRCLKVWYDLPADVLLHAINLFDRFLTKMKVRPCHVPCITVSCMNIAIEHHAQASSVPRTVALEELVSISQSACTARDVERMSRVIADKLSLAAGAGVVSTLHWLRAFSSLVRAAGTQLRLPKALYTCDESELINQLEITACDHACVNARACEVALALLYDKIERQLVEWSRAAESSSGPSGPPLPEHAYRLFELAADLQAICHMQDASLVSTRQLCRAAVARYEARAAAPTRQRLVWRLSERTLKVLRPTDRLTSLLPTIEEQQHNMAVEGTPPRNSYTTTPNSGEETVKETPFTDTAAVWIQQHSFGVQSTSSLSLHLCTSVILKSTNIVDPAVKAVKVKRPVIGRGALFYLSTVTSEDGTYGITDTVRQELPLLHRLRRDD